MLSCIYSAVNNYKLNQIFLFFIIFKQKFGIKSHFYSPEHNKHSGYVYVNCFDLCLKTLYCLTLHSYITYCSHSLILHSTFLRALPSSRRSDRAHTLSLTYSASLKRTGFQYYKLLTSYFKLRSKIKNINRTTEN